MNTYSFLELDLHVKAILQQCGRELTNMLMDKAINFYQKNVLLIDRDRIAVTDSITRQTYEGLEQLYVCLDLEVHKEQKEFSCFFQTSTIHNLGTIGYVLPSFFQSPYGSFKHSLDHYIKDLLTPLILLNII